MDSINKMKLRAALIATVCLAAQAHAAITIQPVIVKGADVSTNTVQATGASVAATLAAHFSKALYVTVDGGALCNGSADDTSASQALINSAAGSATVIFPQGASCVIDGLTVPSNSHLQIDSNVLLKAGANATMFLTTGSNILIEGRGTLNGNASNQSPSNPIAGIENSAQGVSNIIVRGGLTITNVLNWPINLVGVTGAWMSFLTLTNSGNSVEFAVTSNNCWADHITVNNIHDEAFSFYGGVYNCGISDSLLEGATLGAGISVLNDSNQPAVNHDIVIQNNITINNTYGGIESSFGGSGNGDNYNITIVGNRAYGNNLGNHSATGDINLSGTKQTTVVGNTLGPSGNGGNETDGISIAAISNTLLISGNTISNEGQGGTVGVGIENFGAGQVVITGNFIYDNQASKTMAIALNGSAGAYSLITNNFLGPVISGTPDQMTKLQATVVAEPPDIYSAFTIAPYLQFKSLAAPTVSSCGTSPSISGTDNSVTVNVGSGTVTSCAVAFATSRTAAPQSCVASADVSGTPVAADVTAILTTGFTVSTASSVGGGKIHAMCF